AGQNRGGASEATVPPRNLPCLYVNRCERRGPKVAARCIHVVTHANRITKVDTHQLVGPKLFDYGLASNPAQLDDLATAIVAGRKKQKIVFAPDRHADVHARLGLVRMTPQQITIIRVNADDIAIHEGDQLFLTIDIYEEGR